jgi:hypothetical protein
MISQTESEQKKGSVQYLLTILTVAGTIAAASIPL